VAHDPDDPRILGDLHGRVRAARSILTDDRAQLRDDLDMMMVFARVTPPGTSIFPNRLLWAILRAVDDDDHGKAARDELTADAALDWWPTYHAVVALLDAIALGRAGRTEEATARVAGVWDRVHGWALAQGSGDYAFVLAAEAAVEDGWGEPVVWLRGAEAYFAEQGHVLVARRCRRLLAGAGAAVPRRRGITAVPPDLRAIGVTGREVEVLDLVVEGLSNRQIADRLFLSTKTVERHVSSLFDRTGVRSRQALAAWLRARRA
jgi:DNA-binding CsgD family transcriptional regulator